MSDVKKGTHYVGLGSKSLELLRAVQSLLISLDIAGRIYRTNRNGATTFTYTRKGGERVSYESAGPSYDLRITGRSARQYASLVGFGLSHKRYRLMGLTARHGFYNVREEVALVDIRSPSEPEAIFQLPEGWVGLVDGFVCQLVEDV